MKERFEEIARAAVIEYCETLDSSIVRGSTQPNTQAIHAMKCALGSAFFKQIEAMDGDAVGDEACKRFLNFRENPVGHNPDRGYGFVAGAHWAFEQIGNMVRWNLPEHLKTKS